MLRLPEKFPNGSGLKCLGPPTDPGSILKGVESGRIQALVMMENDPLDWGGEAFQKAIAKVPLTILLASHQTVGAKVVTAAIPVRTHAEKDGTFVNAEGFLQRFRRAVEPSDPSVPSSAGITS